MSRTPWASSLAGRAMLPTSGMPGNNADMANMLGRDGKWLCGGEIECYATGRKDRAAPAFPGVAGDLRGVGGRHGEKNTKSGR